jgi:hypothetical protein
MADAAATTNATARITDINFSLLFTSFRIDGIMGLFAYHVNG